MKIGRFISIHGRFISIHIAFNQARQINRKKQHLKNKKSIIKHLPNRQENIFIKRVNTGLLANLVQCLKPREKMVDHHKTQK